MAHRKSDDPLIGAHTSVTGFHLLEERSRRRRRRLGENTPRTPEMLERDRAEEAAEMSWISLAATIKMRQM